MFAKNFARRGRDQSAGTCIFCPSATLLRTKSDTSLLSFASTSGVEGYPLIASNCSGETETVSHAAAPNIAAATGTAARNRLNMKPPSELLATSPPAAA